MIILASQSPRRKELMSQIVKDFTIIVSNIDESTSLNLSPLEAVKDIAYRKGLAVIKDHPNDIVVSADTIVVIDDKIIGKPKNEEDAKRILKLLSGRIHHVYTAYVIMSAEQIIKNVVDTKVEFEELDDEVISRYIATGSPMDKAGAYGIQDKGFNLVKSINGSYTNVMGFPVDEIKFDLNKITM